MVATQTRAVKPNYTAIWLDGKSIPLFPRAVNIARTKGRKQSGKRKKHAQGVGAAGKEHEAVCGQARQGEHRLDAGGNPPARSAGGPAGRRRG